MTPALSDSSAALETRPGTSANRLAPLRRPSVLVATAVAVAVAAWVLFLADGTPAGAAVDDPGTFLVTVLDAVTFAGLLFVAASGFTLIFGLMRTVNMAHGSLFLLAAYVAVRVQEAMVGRSRNIDPADVGAWNGGNNQQWRLNAVGNGRYQIINRGTGTVLDSLGDSTPGSSTAMWAPDSSPNNHWAIASV